MLHGVIWDKLTSEYLPNTFARAMFSRIASKGTTNVAEPRLETISRKLYVWLPTWAENGGGWNGGSPGLTTPVSTNGCEPWTSKRYAMTAQTTTTRMFRAVEINHRNWLTAFWIFVPSGPTGISFAFCNRRKINVKSEPTLHFSDKMIVCSKIVHFTLHWMKKVFMLQHAYFATHGRV